MPPDNGASMPEINGAQHAVSRTRTSPRATITIYAAATLLATSKSSSGMGTGRRQVNATGRSPW